jgi:hypothetical protein
MKFGHSAVVRRFTFGADQDVGRHAAEPVEFCCTESANIDPIYLDWNV